MDTDKPCSKIPDEVSETVKRAFLASPRDGMSPALD